MKQALPLFTFLRTCTARGEAAALVTLTDVIGGSARAPGHHMAVSASGVAIGSFSGGCIEAAVIAEAQAAIAAGNARTVRFGAGSPYIDIRLPCGGGVDLHFLPRPSLKTLDKACTLLGQRRSVSLLLSGGELCAEESSPPDRTGWTAKGFRSRHDPALRLLVFGHGAEPGALLRLAKGIDAEGLLLSPDATCVAEVRELGFSAELLRIAGRSDMLVSDGHTAIISLFHDHDWEMALLAQAVEQPAFFIGAMGSRRTHAQRCSTLIEAGTAASAVHRIVGPVGLLPGSRDPQTLAVSILAQIVAEQGRMLTSDRPYRS